MKVYFHLSLEGFTNSYVVVNDDPSVMEALIIDPGKISEEIITQIENGPYKLSAVLITHNHEYYASGLRTLNKIYTPKVYAADYEVMGSKPIVIRGDGSFREAGLDIQYFAVPGHTNDSMVFKIGSILFTGDALTAGLIGETTGKFFKSMLVGNIQKKILTQTDDTVIMPGYGPPTTVGAERQFNMDIPRQHK